ncbi:MAG: FAD-binding protein, partial [Candidatus Lambdaproteobacteria bacterium]|nr:FAD-binding protein [Candidatus Lambdaproteobacteria bacterium]
ARAIRAEVHAGRGSPHGGAFLDIAHQVDAETIRRKLPSMYHQFKHLGDVDITKQAMEVGPTCHYIMGGVRVDADTAATTVPGLYAAGEVAAGLHGANRLGGNSLSDLVVFGRRAGAAAANDVRDKSMPKISDAQIKAAMDVALAPFNDTGKENPYALLQELQESMDQNVGIIRVKAELEKGLANLQTLKERLGRVKIEGNQQYNPGWHYALDLRNQLIVSEAVATSALHREESRGGHTREDFPESTPRWEKVNTVVRARNGQMQVEHVQRPPMPPELAELLKD